MKDLGTPQRKAILETLRLRFEKNIARHEGIQWSTVETNWKPDPTSYGPSANWTKRQVDAATQNHTRNEGENAAQNVHLVEPRVGISER